MQKLDYDFIKLKQFQKYSAFNIPIEILESKFNIVLKNNKEEIDVITCFNKSIEQYIIDEIRNDNIDMQISVIDYYSNLKTRIKVNQKYNLSDDILNSAYEESIEMLKEEYDSDKTLYLNILSNMKYVLTGQKSEKEINLYDISFMKDYIKYHDFNKNNLMKLLECDKNTFSKIINGEKQIDKIKLNNILNYYNLNKYDELKEFIKKELEKYYKKEIKKQKKNNSKYNISFMKNYIEKNNIPKMRLAQVLEVNSSSIDKILDGIYLISDEKIKLLYTLYKVDNYDELKEKINNSIITNEEKKEVPQKYNFSFMKEYVILYNIQKKELTEIFKCGINKVDYILDGNILLNENITSEVCYELRCKDYDSLKKMIIEKINRKKQILLANEKEIENKKILTTPTKKVEKIIKLEDIDKEELFKMLDYKNMNYMDSIITLLLFSDIVKCNIDEISKFLEINKYYITKIYREDLDKIKEKLKEKNKNTKLEYKNIE